MFLGMTAVDVNKVVEKSDATSMMKGPDLMCTTVIELGGSLDRQIPLQD